MSRLEWIGQEVFVQIAGVDREDVGRIMAFLPEGLLLENSLDDLLIPWGAIRWVRKVRRRTEGS